MLKIKVAFMSMFITGFLYTQKAYNLDSIILFSNNSIKYEECYTKLDGLNSSKKPCPLEIKFDSFTNNQIKRLLFYFQDTINDWSAQILLESFGNSNYSSVLLYEEPTSWRIQQKWIDFEYWLMKIKLVDESHLRKGIDYFDFKNTLLDRITLFQELNLSNSQIILMNSYEKKYEKLCIAFNDIGKINDYDFSIELAELKALDIEICNLVVFDDIKLENESASLNLLHFKNINKYIYDYEIWQIYSVLFNNVKETKKAIKRGRVGNVR